MPVPVLEGPFVRLRPPKAGDLLTLFAWYNDPETVAPFDRFSVDRFEDFEVALRDAPNDPRSLAPRFVVERKSDPRILGFVGHYQAHPVLTLTDVWYVLGERAER
ncbi:MAG TPA: GNAT family N-acetyltransferase, partial [Thermoplasmata archaeon]